MELDFQSLFGFQVHSCTHWPRPRNPPLPAHLAVHIRGRYWSAKKDDISGYGACTALPGKSSSGVNQTVTPDSIVLNPFWTQKKHAILYVFFTLWIPEICLKRRIFVTQGVRRIFKFGSSWQSQVIFRRTTWYLIFCFARCILNCRNSSPWGN